MNCQDINAKSIDSWCKNGWQWGKANLYEDTNGEGKLHEYNIPSFWAARAVKP